MFESLASELREAREKAGISKHEAASKIRIDLKFLEAMEAGNFTFLAEVYVKAFLKDYARLLDLNDKAVLKKYEMLRDGQSETAEQTAGEETTPPAAAKVSSPPDHTKTGEREFVDESLERARIADKKKMMIASAAGLLIVISALVYILISDRSDEVVVERPFSEVLEQNKKRYEEPVAAADSSVPAGDSLSLKIRATDTVWVSITPDAGRSVEYKIFPGKFIETRAAEKFSMHIGNSYAVLLELNGEVLSLPPQRPRVFKGIITEKGVQ